ncbi:MAG: hypothetical protein ACXVCP_07615 [Bdellovibrio sp.]
MKVQGVFFGCRWLNITLVIVMLGFHSFAVASTAPDLSFVQVGTKQIKEDDVTFTYTSNDGTIALKCAHVFDKPESNDWDVWCGKGTKLLRQFRIHFLVRKYESRSSERSAFEVLYWVTDRDQAINKSFSSTSSWIQFKNSSNLEKLSFSQGIENDYAYLTVELKP